MDRLTRLAGLLAGLALITATADTSFADQGMEILKSKCVSCHNIKGPAPKSVDELWQRKGPDLFYAGVKYKPDWVEAWLQKPTQIRPAGYPFFRNLKTRKGRSDVLDNESFEAHAPLTKAEAKAVTKTLAAFRGNEALITKMPADAEEIDEYMAEIKFKKSAGCISCHRISPTEGGVTGSELYTAAKRLQTDFMFSYLKNPQAWDPKVPMPRIDLRENTLATLTNYIIYLSEEDE